MAGGMGVRKNAFIEEWASRRENLEHVFKYTRGAWARLAVFGFAVPFGIYHMIASEMLNEKSNAYRTGPIHLGYEHTFFGGYEAKKQEE